MKLEDILSQLTAKFEPEQHKERAVKGGSKWWYVSHTEILDRLNQVCPGEWSTEYTLSHVEPDGSPIYLCKLTICGVTKTGIGDKSNEQSTFGTPAQRAFRKAFTDACEQFGIAAYLDDQRGEKTKAEFANYMHKRGNSKPAVQLQNEQRGHARPKPTATPKPFGQPQPTASTLVKPISTDQVKRFWVIARGAGYTDEAVKKLVEAHGFSSSKEITTAIYETICEKAGDPEYVAMYNDMVEKMTVEAS